MPPLLSMPRASAPSRSSKLAINSVMQRFAAVSLSTSARLAVPRQLPHSSGASVLGLDKEHSRSHAPSAPSSSHNPNSFGRSGRSDANAALSRVLLDSEYRNRIHERYEENKRSTIERMKERKTSEDYQRQMPRRWRVGDLYAPHDLTPHEAHKWKTPRRANADVLDILGLNPIYEYRNFSMISEYMTTMGNIRGSQDTGLRPVNQRRMAKAIRRATGLGIHPSVHRHPEILLQELASMPRPSYMSQDGKRQKSFKI